MLPYKIFWFLLLLLVVGYVLLHPRPTMWDSLPPTGSIYIETSIIDRSTP